MGHFIGFHAFAVYLEVQVLHHFIGQEGGNGIEQPGDFRIGVGKFRPQARRRIIIGKKLLSSSSSISSYWGMRPSVANTMPTSALAVTEGLVDDAHVHGYNAFAKIGAIGLDEARQSVGAYGEFMVGGQNQFAGIGGNISPSSE